MIFFYQRKNLTNFCPNIELNGIYQKSHNTVTNHNYILCVVRILMKQTLRMFTIFHFEATGNQAKLIFATNTGCIGAFEGYIIIQNKVWNIEN